jgi:hypothetical protein
MTIESATNRGPLEVAATRVVESNAFALGVLLAFDGGAWVLADHTVAGRAAVGLVVASAPDHFLLVTARGEVVRWPEHGHVAVDGQARLWLGTAGGYATSQPAGAGVRTVQVVALVLDADHLLLFPPEPFTF